MLIHKFFLAQKEGTPVEIWGSGKSLREFIFSEDVALLTKMLYDDYKGEDPVILSTSQEISISDLVDIIAQAFNFKGEIKFDTAKPDGQFRKPSDNSIITSMYPDFKFTPVEEGIKKSVEWFCLLAKSITTARVISPFVGKLSQEITATPGKLLSNLATSRSNSLAGNVSKEFTSAISAWTSAEDRFIPFRAELH